ncbi:hypothetical protein ABH920_006282 [Catenulispora sp. EB89]|uniref:hypothetical protein n=1 Tax=Catenulispora sp. EB89 TaxID=3156257 RepID=UPI0035171BBC
MTDVVAGVAALAAALVLVACGLAIRRDAFGIVSRNTRMATKVYGRLKDPPEVRATMERNARHTSIGFIVVGGVMAVVDALWLVKALV